MLMTCLFLLFYLLFYLGDRDARKPWVLIKVTLLQNTMEDIHEVAEILEEEIGCDTVLKIGRILILYKESAKKENRKLSPKVKAIQK